MVCHVEREAFPASTLVARMEDQAVDQAPVWDDIATFDGRPWRGLVDVVTAGLPCQPYSLAGAQKGHDDDRALWPEFVRIVEEVEPAFLFFENVAPYLRFYGPVWAELSRMGFIHAPPLLHTAHEQGAIHERRRLFVLAAHPDRAAIWFEQGWFSGANRANSSFHGDDSHETANRNSVRRSEGQQSVQAGKSEPNGHHRHSSNACSQGLAIGPEQKNGPGDIRDKGPAATQGGHKTTNGNSHGLALEWSGWLFDAHRQTLRHDVDRCGDGCRICGSIWETESPPVRVDHGSANRLVELRAIGNGVV